MGDLFGGLSLQKPPRGDGTGNNIDTRFSTQKYESWSWPSFKAVRGSRNVCSRPKRC